MFRECIYTSILWNLWTTKLQNITTTNSVFWKRFLILEAHTKEGFTEKTDTDPLQFKCHAISESPTPLLSLIPKLGCSRACCHRNSIILRPRKKDMRMVFRPERDRDRERKRGEKLQDFTIHISSYRGRAFWHQTTKPYRGSTHHKWWMRAWTCCSKWSMRRTVETMLMKVINCTYILGCTGSLYARAPLQLVRNVRMLPSAGLSSTPHHTMTSGRNVHDLGRNMSRDECMHPEQCCQVGLEPHIIRLF